MIKLAVLATTLSVMVMILSLAISTGFQYVVKEKLYCFNGHVHVSNFDVAHSNTRTAPTIGLDATLLAKMRQIPHVVQVTPFVQRPVIVQAHNHTEGIGLKGVGKGYRFPKGISLGGEFIAYPDSGYSHQILLSERTASKLDVRAGDTVNLQFIDETARPRVRRVKVSGLYHSGMEEVDNNFALCDIRLLQRLNNWSGDSINAYQLDLDNESFADTVSNYIFYNLLKAPLGSNTTAENYPNIFDWLHLQTLNSTILLIIMAVVSIINIGAVLLILMVDRAAMVGLLKALGLPFNGTVAIFLYVGAIIGALGILFGNILALGLCWLQQHFGLVTLPEETYYMKYAPVKVIWWHVLATDVVTLLLFVICMWLPALYIRTIQPAKVLQFK